MSAVLHSPYADPVSGLPADFTLLQVVPELETGGAEQTTIDIARAVVAAGGRALVASRGGRMAPRLKEAGGELFAMPAQSKNPLVIIGNAVRLSRLIREQNVSIIHARSRAPAVSALIAARATGIPYLATYHGVYRAKSAIKRLYNSVMTRGAVVIANSEFTRERVIAEHNIDPDKVIAINRGVDLERFDPAAVSPERVATLAAGWKIAPGDRRVKILLAGRLTRWKGQKLLIDAAVRLKAEGREDFLILLAGDDQGRGSYRSELDTAIRRAGLDDAVRIVGHCNDMPAAYLVADVACAPSLDPEPFGRTAVEPQLMGRPVLAADHGGARETVVAGQTGWLVAPGDVEAWAKALAEAIDAGPVALAAMGAAGQVRARRLYSAQAMCDATLEIYAGLLARLPEGRG
jgi:glycosyltransferase involved in cell wall biosynthesis